MTTAMKIAVLVSLVLGLFAYAFHISRPALIDPYGSDAELYLPCSSGQFDSLVEVTVTPRPNQANTLLVSASQEVRVSTAQVPDGSWAGLRYHDRLYLAHMEHQETFERGVLYFLWVEKLEDVTPLVYTYTSDSATLVAALGRYQHHAEELDRVLDPTPLPMR